MAPMLAAGAKFKKHASKLGRPKEREVKVVQGVIIWGEDGKGIPLRDVKDIIRGQETSAFKRTGKKGNDRLCFSVISINRTLDLEAETSEICEMWATALEEAVHFKDTSGPDQDIVKQQIQDKAASVIEERRKEREAKKKELMAKYKKK